MSEGLNEGAVKERDTAGGSSSPGAFKRTSLNCRSLPTRSVRTAVLTGARAHLAPSDEGSPNTVAKAWAAMDVRLRFTLLDTFLSFFVFTPLVIVFWLGTYGLLDLTSEWLGAEWAPWAMLFAGIYVETVVCFLQHDLAQRLPSSGGSQHYSHYLTTRLFFFFLSVANIAHYRALEILYQTQVNVNVTVALQTAVTATLVLWSLKCGRNIVGPPLCVEIDTAVENVYETSTRFKTTPGRSLSHLLDALTSVTIVTSLIHVHWISITSVFDYLLYPNNIGLSVVASCVLGYSIVFFFILCQGPARRASSFFEKKSEIGKILFEDSYFVCANIGVILVWRGLGQFFDALGRFFPIYHLGSDVTWVYSLLVPFILLMLAHTSGTLVTKGCDVDGEFLDGEGINFNISYFADFFSEEIEKQVKQDEDKRNRNLNEPKKFR